MEKRDSSLDGLYDELAGRFAALGQLFDHLGSPEAARGLIEALTVGDSAAFGRLTDRVGFEMIGKCAWLRDVIERTLHTFTGYHDEWRLREDLTPAERLTYIRIVVRYRIIKMDTAGLTPGDPSVIPPGPFLDELKANGLVTSKTVPTYDNRLVPVLAPPQRICV